MAESSLSIGFVDLKQAVGHFLGYGATETQWTATQAAEIEGVVQSGVRRVYYPPAVNAETLGYEWSFLQPTTTLTVTAGVADYDLPDDLGRLSGDLHYAADQRRPPVILVSLGTLLSMRSHEERSDAPAFMATRFKASDGSTGSRQEVLLYPEPDVEYVLTYEYDAYSGKLTDEYPYPLGGMSLAELFLESCLAVAEQRVNDEVGSHTAIFQALLVDAIARDRKHGARYFGPMGHRESDSRRPWHGDTGASYPITYKGSTW